MKLVVAPDSGFCFGVKRSIGMVSDLLKKNDEQTRIFMLGEIIHNPIVVKEFTDKGIKVIYSLDEIENPTEKDIVIIRSHGVAINVIKEAEKLGLKIINTTCPFVKKIEELVFKLFEENFEVIVIGDKNHPEVKGLVESFSDKIKIVENSDDAKKMSDMLKLGVVAQTTQTFENFSSVIQVLLTKSKEIRIFNTICKATYQRQNSALDMAGRVDFIIVIGGKNSANTTRLYKICKEINQNIIHIEEPEEIDFFELKKYETIGITAGASTPAWIIEKTIEIIESN